MDLKLKDNVFIVTGGGKGIGNAICRTLASEKAYPVIVGRAQAEARHLVNTIVSQGGKAAYFKADLGDNDHCKAIVDFTIEKFGRIDGVVNNAGVNDGVGLEHGNLASFKHSVLTNLLHYYDLVHHALPELKKTKGSVVNISSKTAITGQGGTSGYVASKGAQLALTREWAVELAPYGIRVNAIIPAEVMTPQYEKWIQSFDNPQEQLDKITAKIPLENRMTTAEEIAAQAVFLLSEKSAHTTGQWFFIDGGYVHLDRAMC